MLTVPGVETKSGDGADGQKIYIFISSEKYSEKQNNFRRQELGPVYINQIL